MSNPFRDEARFKQFNLDSGISKYITKEFIFPSNNPGRRGSIESFMQATDSYQSKASQQTKSNFNTMSSISTKMNKNDNSSSLSSSTASSAISIATTKASLSPATGPSSLISGQPQSFYDNLTPTERFDICLKEIRKGKCPGHLRGQLWLALMGINPSSMSFIKVETKYNYYVNLINKCPGCERLLESHLSTFGANFIYESFVPSIQNAERAWHHNLFRRHCLSKTGIDAAKRIMLVLQRELNIEYCPFIPDLVCILLLYLTEVESYAVARELVTQSVSTTSCRWTGPSASSSAAASSSANNSSYESSFASPEELIIEKPFQKEFFFPTDARNSAIFVRTFKDEVSKRLPSTFKVLCGKGMRKLSENLFKNWFEQLFLPVLSLRHVIRFVDCLIVEGAKVFYRFGLALLKIFKKDIEALEIPVTQATGEINKITSLLEVSYIKRFEAAQMANLSLGGGRAFAAGSISSQNDSATMISAMSLTSNSSDNLMSRNEQSDENDIIRPTIVGRPRGNSIEFPGIRVVKDEVELHKTRSNSDSKLPTFPERANTSSSVDIGTGEYPRKKSFFLSGIKSIVNAFSGESSSANAASNSDETFDHYFEKDKGADLENSLSHEFTFSKLLATAYGFRQLRRSDFAKSDKIHEKELGLDYQPDDSLVIPTPHYSGADTIKSATLSNINASSRLIGWLPPDVRRKAPEMKLLYSTEVHGRSLGTLYRECNPEKQKATSHGYSYLVLIKAANPVTTASSAGLPRLSPAKEVKKALPKSADLGASASSGAASSSSTSSQNQVDWMIFGFFTNQPLVPSAASSTPSTIGTETFVFRLYPEPDAEVWKFTPTVLAGMSKNGSWKPNKLSFGQGSSRHIRSGSGNNKGSGLGVERSVSNGNDTDAPQFGKNPKQKSRFKRYASDARRNDAPRMQFVSCRFDTIWVGSVTNVQIVRGKYQEDSDEEQEQDPLKAQMELNETKGQIQEARKKGTASDIIPETKTRMVGPALWVDSDLLLGRTGYCATFRNDPLCIHANDPTYQHSSDPNRETLLHMRHYFFDIAALEVFIIPSD